MGCLAFLLVAENWRACVVLILSSFLLSVFLSFFCFVFVLLLAFCTHRHIIISDIPLTIDILGVKTIIEFTIILGIRHFPVSH